MKSFRAKLAAFLKPASVPAILILISTRTYCRQFYVFWRVFPSSGGSRGLGGRYERQG